MNGTAAGIVGTIRVRSAREDDMMAVLAWRNHPDIRRFMLTRHEIGAEEHRQWFTRALGNHTRHLLIAETERSEPLGFVHFSTLDGGMSTGAVLEWGFYRAPDAPRGSGRRFAHAALVQAFGALGAHKVFGQVLDFNEPSRQLHERLGFRQEGVLRDQYVDQDGAYHALYCYGLLRDEFLGATLDPIPPASSVQS